MLSGNEVERLKSLRGKLATLCPETDGLQAKHRIRRVLKGKTHKERVEEMFSILNKGNKKQYSHNSNKIKFNYLNRIMNNNLINRLLK